MVEFSLHAWDSTSRTSPLWALFAPLNDVENGECALEFRFSKPLLFYNVIMRERRSATVIIPC